MGIFRTGLHESWRGRPWHRALAALALVPVLLAAAPPSRAEAAEPGIVALVRAPDGSISVEQVVTAAGRGGSADGGPDVASTLAAVRARPDVVAADVDVPTRALGGDPYRSQQWALDMLAASKTWNVSTGTGVTVAVLDSGVQAAHPDLTGAVAAGADFSGEGGDGRTDARGHGTHVAGIVAAARGNGIGTAGFSSDARILPVQVIASNGVGMLSWAAQGIIWATDQGADVINMSFGSSSGHSVLDAAVDYAHRRGVTLVAASGNDGGARALWPAAHPDVISVGATTSSDQVASFSNRDPNLDLVAPGASITSTCVVSTWCRMTGTSMAAPYASAAVAAVQAARPDLGPDGIRSLLRQTAVDLGSRGHDAASGYGRINVLAALEAALSSGDPFRQAGSGLERVGDTTNNRAVATATSQVVFADGAELAVVARDDVFADSLTGAALAGQRGPVLFTPGGSSAALAPETATELQRVLDPGSPVYVLGGEAAISRAAMAEISSLGFAVQRIAGATRVDTAARVADELVPSGASVDRVLLARADSWADAVTGSSYAAATSTPILLTSSDRLDDVTADWLAHHDVAEVVVLGGEAAVTAAAASQVDGFVHRVRRSGGANRAETAALVARDLWQRRVGTAGDRFVIVEGYHPDSWGSAVAAAVLSATQQAPQLLVADTAVPAGTAAYLGDLAYEHERSATATVVGGNVGTIVGYRLMPLIGRS